MLSLTLHSRSQGRDEQNLKTLQGGGQKQGPNFGFLRPAHVTTVEEEAKLSINPSVTTLPWKQNAKTSARNHEWP